jgi:hypothetical protein
MTRSSRVFITTWRAARGVDDVIKTLRAFLKLGLRRFGLRCVSIQTEPLERRHKRLRASRRHEPDRKTMKRDDVFQTRYLKASDLAGRPRIFTIEEAPLLTLKNTKGEEQQKTVLVFAGEKKSLPLNMTNWDAVADICGGDTEDWPGGKVELYPTKTSMGGKTVDCIRIRAPKSSPKTPKPAPRVPSSNDDEGALGLPAGPEDLDDIIPY